MKIIKIVDTWTQVEHTSFRRWLKWYELRGGKIVRVM